MVALKGYMNDGAGAQARCVLALLQEIDFEDLPSDEENYLDFTSLSRWDNGREQGYIITLRNKNFHQYNVAFFEHRSSDSIEVLEWKGYTNHSPTFHDIASDHLITIFKPYEFIDVVKFIKSGLKNHWEVKLSLNH